MKTFLSALLVLFWATTSSAQVRVSPMVGASVVTSDGNTKTVSEVLVDAGYKFRFSESSNVAGELCYIHGYGDEGNKVVDFGYRAYVYGGGAAVPGFGVHVLLVDEEIAKGIEEDSVAFGPEILLEIPWSPSLFRENSNLTAYGALYLPISGDEDFRVIRLGVRTGI